MKQVLLNPLPGDNPFDDAWAHRAYRAHMNAFEGLIIFAPMVLAVQLTGSNNSVTEICSALYFWPRVVYTPMYYFNVPVFRTLIWSVGFISSLVIGFQVIL